MPKRYKVSSVSDLNPGEAKTLTVDGVEVGVFNVEGKFHAVDNACPHRGGPLSEGRLDGCVATCPWHGWQFDLKTGTLLMNPETKLKTYKVVRDGDDLYVEA